MGGAEGEEGKGGVGWVGGAASATNDSSSARFVGSAGAGAAWGTWAISAQCQRLRRPLQQRAVKPPLCPNNSSSNNNCSSVSESQSLLSLLPCGVPFVNFQTFAFKCNHKAAAA